MATTAGFSDYTASNATQTGPTSALSPKSDFWSLERLKRSYRDYIGSKVQEVEEQKNSRRYRHGSQYTSEQIKVYNRRKQPVVTYNRIGRKIDGVIGLVEKLKQSPKAYPRTPNEEGGADLATAVVRAVLDAQEWKTKSWLSAHSGAVDGIGGVELLLEKGDNGDPDIGFEFVECDGFFYDPRSYKLDFSDARYMGQGKWLDFEEAKEMFPDKAALIQDAMDSAFDLSSNSDREQKWFIADGNVKRIRIVDEWYKLGGEWCWCIYTGHMKLQEGKSWLKDEKGKTSCKFVMYSAAIDHDGDRYGFVRNLKSAQDEINQRRSKALHLLNTRRIIAEDGAFNDIEVARREAIRPDGVVIRNKGFEAEFDDGAKAAEMQGQIELLTDAKSEVENFGPNPALIGQGSLGDKSGRAIALLQQAGIAELGPFILSYRGWKIRLYRAIWNAARENWKAERFVRVTDDQNSLQFIPINQVGIHPQTGMPAMVNHIAALDVDIIMDEGPDSLNMMADTYDALLAIAQNGANVPPDVLIELAPGIDNETRKRLIERLKTPDPMQQNAQQLQLMSEKSVIDMNEARAKLSNAQALAAVAAIGQGPDVKVQEPDNPAVIAAEIDNKNADTMQKKAQALKTMQETALAPQEQAHQQQMDHASANQNQQKIGQGSQKMALDQHNTQQDQAIGQHNAEADRAHQADMNSQKVAAQGGSAPKKKKKSSGVNISLDGTMASQLSEHAQKNSDSMQQVTHVLAQATQVLAQASKSMADSSQAISESVGHMARAVTAPKRLVRDAKGRASHVETVV